MKVGVEKKGRENEKERMNGRNVGAWDRKGTGKSREQSCYMVKLF